MPPGSLCIGEALNLAHESMKFCYFDSPSNVLHEAEVVDREPKGHEEDSVTQPCEKRSLTHAQERTFQFPSLSCVCENSGDACFSS